MVDSVVTRIHCPAVDTDTMDIPESAEGVDSVGLINFSFRNPKHVAQLTEISRLRATGKKWREISSIVGIREETLRASFTKWSKTEGGVVAIAKTGVSLISPSEPVSASKTIAELSQLVRDLLARDAHETATRIVSQHPAPSDLTEENERETVIGKLVERSKVVLGWESATDTVQISIGVLASLPDLEPEPESVQGVSIDVPP